MPNFIKLCGFQKQEDIDVACNSGANFIGFVFCENSPRYIAPEQFKLLNLTKMQGAQTVGVFQNASLNLINAVLNCNNISYIQLHNASKTVFLECVKMKPVIYVFEGENFNAQALQEYSQAKYFLFDAPAPGSGTERSFAFAKTISSLTKKEFFLAGGINIINYRNALQYTNLIDISSGIEIQRGVKNQSKIIEIIKAVHG